MPTLEDLGFEPDVQAPKQADPLDYSDKYNSPIPANRQKDFDNYVKTQKLTTGRDPLKDRYDYDVNGLFLSGQGQDGRGHSTDQFKKPNHPTFSDQSQYHGKDGFTGGHWDEAAKTYEPSATNLQFRNRSEMEDYFKREESDSGYKLAQPKTQTLADLGFEPDEPAKKLPKASAILAPGQTSAAGASPATHGAPVSPADIPKPAPLPGTPNQRFIQAVSQPIIPVAKINPALRAGREALPDPTPADWAANPIGAATLAGGKSPATGGAIEGVTKLAEGLTTPQNIAILGATEGLGLLGKAGQVAQRLISAGFSADMLHSAYQQVPAIKEAIDKGDTRAAAEQLTQFAGTIAMAGAAGHHAAAGGAAHGVSTETETAIPEPVVAVPEPIPAKAETKPQGGGTLDSVSEGLKALGFEPDAPAPAEAQQPVAMPEAAKPAAASNKIDALGFEPDEPVKPSISEPLAALGFEPDEAPTSPSNEGAKQEAGYILDENGQPLMKRGTEAPADEKTAEPLEPFAPQPGTITKLPTEQLNFDPQRFQFKQDTGGKFGTGEELKEVKKFDQEKSGILSVWHDPEDGKTYVVNGHHRGELAVKSGEPNVAVRYLDAKDATEARMKGALINIAEGRGTALDAAKVFRDSGLDQAQLEEQGVSIKGEKARQGLALAQLDPSVFRRVVEGDLPIERATVIGEGLGSHEDQRAILDLVDKSKRHVTNDQIAEMIRLVNGETGKHTETQNNLFGSEEVTRSLIKEKAEVSDYIRKRLGQEKKLFEAVGKESAASQLSDAGNVIKAADNAKIAESTGQVQALYDKLSTSAGTVNESLERAAALLANGESSPAVKEQAYGEIKRGLLEQARKLTGEGGTPRERSEGNAQAGLSEAGGGQLDRPREAESTGSKLKQAISDLASDTTGAVRPRKIMEGLGSLFGDDEEARVEQETKADREKLTGDTLTAQFNAPLSRDEQLKKLKPGEKPVQESMFEKAPEKSQFSLFSDTRGQADPTLGVKRFAERDVLPALDKIADAVTEFKDQALRIVAPSNLGSSAEFMGLNMRQRMAQFARRYDVAAIKMRTAEKFFDKRTPEQNYKFMDDIERGRKTGDEHLDQVAAMLRKAFDQRRREVQALGEGELERYYRNYFPHIFEKPGKATEFFANYKFNKANFEGSKSFLKHRQFPTIKEAMENGQVPVSDNPITLALTKIREMDRYLMAHATLRDAGEHGYAVRIADKQKDDVPGHFAAQHGGLDLEKWTVPGKDDVPEGFVSISDPIGNGKWYAEEGAAQVLNNYLTPGLRARSGAYRILTGIGNVMNQSNLGLSAFHLTGEVIRSSVGRVALGIEHAIEGKPLKGLRVAAGAPVAPFLDMIRGNKVLNEWGRPGSEGAPIIAMVDAMMKAGGRANMTEEHSNRITERMVKEFRHGNIPGTLMRAPLAALEKSAVVMNWAIPRMKAGAFADLAAKELERMGPNAKIEDVRKEMASIWDSIDNRFGLMVYDNLFWNKTFKDLMHLGIRSVGWNLGIREITGGVKDLGRVARGKPMEQKHKLAYTLALPIVSGLIGSMYQYAHTGKGPQELKDYFFPKREDGSRISLPTDVKDIYHLATEPYQTVVNKMSPILSTITSMVRNKDYFDRPIRNPDDPIMKQLMQEAGYVGRQAQPFTLQSHTAHPESNPEHKVENFLGFTRAPSPLQPGYKPRKIRQLSK